IPGVKYGNIFLAPQPSRGEEQDPSKLYHDLTVPPHHQYIAFYLWLKKEFKADALIHFGTHGTHEWLPGKEVGLSEEDAPDILLQDLPNIYVYIVDNVGEGLQAKRRGLAVIIDHMTPPFDKSGLNKELRNIKALLDEYSVAKDKSPLLAEAKLKEINELAKKIGINKDLGLEEFITDKDIEVLEEYLEEIDNTNVPLGLHTFGKIPEEKFIESTLSAMLSYEKSLKEEEKVKKRAEYENRIRESGERELNSLILALEGKYIPSGQGGDPLRAPYSLPTGKNFYAFDPSKIPSKSIYALGVNLAKELIEKYRETHKTYPDKIAFNLWATETIRHEGIMESQILYLLGIKPKWDERGRVIGLEVIPASELQRPRIDVVIIASGLYRDLFSNLIGLLDQAVNLAKDQEEKENFVRKNYLQTKEKLKAMKISEEVIEKLAGVRIFSEPPGSYGTNLDKIIALSNTWESEKEVVEVFFKRLSFGYGQGFWGNWNEVDNKLNMELGIRLFKNALSGSKIAIHSRSTNLYATLDNDDFFQYLGGTAMAIRALDGKNPELYVTNLSNPHKVGQESLQKFMGRELRSRYLNPQWIKTMLKEGYAGARFIDKVVEHLWGWQVTVPEIVDSTKWKEIYETYVLDKYGLNIKDYFKGSNNFWAYQSIVARLLEVTRKKYWNPEREVVENLAKEYAATVKEVGLACCDHTCNNPLLTKYTTNILLSVPTLKPEEISKFLKALEKVTLPPSAGEKLNPSEKITSKQALAPGGKMKNIEGYEVEEKTINSLSASSAPIPYLFLLGILIFFSLIIYGFKRNKRGL
ncbi:MAG: cobaltochelatase subunit CobN, partial [Thermodesulfobacteriaceae bacterium]|nr:cobaltochelatase subunit CobN [Thermodesulfobacteriaceae bacterium]